MSNITQFTQVVDNETGEVLYAYTKENNFDRKVCKYEVDKMIEESESSKDLDGNLLYHWCKVIQVINSRGQIQTIGTKLNSTIERKMVEEGIVCAYVLKAIMLAHPFTHILKKNHMTQIKTWGELWDSISCSNIRTQQKVKKFLEENKLIKCVPIKKDNGTTQNLFVLNPYLYKNSSHAGQFACIVWQECAKPNININFYAYMWLVSQDCIILDENTNYNEIVENFFVNKSKKMKK